MVEKRVLTVRVGDMAASHHRSYYNIGKCRRNLILLENNQGPFQAFQMEDYK